jgi:hypothetical protein
MTDSINSQPEIPGQVPREPTAISIVQRGNLKNLEQTLRKQWRLGQSIVLCWSPDERGLMVIFVPHYFLGNYCAVEGAHSDSSSDNETFIRQLISGRRRRSRDELFAIADRLGVAPTFIKLNAALSKEANVEGGVEELIKRYGLSFVDNRAVVLFDIAEFSLFTPFEQASQLNSLSYSLNSAYNKLLSQGIEVNFARTTTGDGYYVWNRNLTARANENLYYFLLLAIADNNVARAVSRGNTVPVIRSAYHIGSHYELYQAEGVNPTVFSYIVGDVTIELSRMVDKAQPDQIWLGDFKCEMQSDNGSVVDQGAAVSSPAFVRNCNRELAKLSGLQISGKPIRSLSCRLSADSAQHENSEPRRFCITDKHGLEHYAYNLQLEIGLEGEDLCLGTQDSRLSDSHATPATPVRPEVEPPRIARTEPASAAKMYNDLASMLKKHAKEP